MKNKLLAAGLGVFLTAGVIIEAFAQSPAVLVRQRQSAMVLQSKYQGLMNPKAAYNQADFARNAAYLETLSNMAWDGFQPATQGEKSRALPAIYTDGAKFKQYQDDFKNAASKLAAAAKTGPEQTVRAAWGDVNKTCQVCHDAFRASN